MTHPDQDVVMASFVSNGRHPPPMMPGVFIGYELQALMDNDKAMEYLAQAVMVWL